VQTDDDSLDLKPATDSQGIFDCLYIYSLSVDLYSTSYSNLVFTS